MKDEFHHVGHKETNDLIDRYYQYKRIDRADNCLQHGTSASEGFDVHRDLGVPFRRSELRMRDDRTRTGRA